jgi:hypothetical protein
MRTSGTTPSGTDARVRPIAPRLARLARLISAFSGVQGFVFIFFTLVATGFGLAFTQQGLDIVGAATAFHGDAREAAHLRWLCIATFLLGFQGWFWARACVEEQVGPRSHWRGNLLLLWAPRVFALIPFGFLTWALTHQVFSPPSWSVLALVGSGALLLIFVIARQDLTLRLRRQADRIRVLGHPRKANALDAALDQLRPFLISAGLVVWVGFLGYFIYDPVTLPVRIGPCAIVLLDTALIIPVMVTLIQMGRRVGVRATEWILVVMLVVGSLVDNHTVRLAPPTANPVSRDDVGAAYARWRSQWPAAGGGPLPIIFVAVPGGASRAGFWGGEVLSRLEEMSGGAFSRHTFVISSVSGGSVGAVGFLASLTDPAPRLPLHTRVGDFTAQDFLSPSFASAAFPDLVQRVFPVAVFPDRAEALERGWEAAWRQHCQVIGGCRDPDLLQRSFMSSWRGTGRWSPILAINGVHEETGGLILTSTTPLSGYVVADDFNDTTRSDVRLSTAILNGARFPYISPGGTYFGYVGAGDRAKRVELGHIVDGGYFDAAGVETTRELARGLFARLGDADRRDLRPIYLVIANSDPPTPPKPANLDPDLFGPLKGLFAAGGAHGAQLTRLIKEAPPGTTNAQAPVPVIIRLCRKGAPMDWVLSRASVDFMRDQLGGPTKDPCGNYAQMLQLVRGLGVDPARQAPPT